jgi:NADPH-dependent glutamate synthase beta subunit-like oxidoreductase/Fe-S oxidoreductase
MTHNPDNLSWPEKILSECIGEAPPPCQAACPLDIRVREKIRFLKEGKPADALAVVLERCPFPGILGRICHHPCETACSRTKLDDPIAIALLKRYLADGDPGRVLDASPGPERPEAVAIVGGGPAGLMAAYELRKLGYPVTIFEGESALGGALRLYIPPYRLPRQVLDREIGLVEKLGARVRLGTRLGRDLQLEDLRRDFAAVFLALGAHKAISLQVPGEELAGVMDGIAFLKGVNSGQAAPVGKSVAVVGGGRVALDAARSARRLGAAVTVICLESLEEMPASGWELAEAQGEGVEVLPRWGVKRLLGRDGQVRGLELKAVARVFDEAGRFSPVFFEDRLTVREADAVIVAIGQTSDFGFFGPGLAFDTATRHRLEIDRQTMATQIPGVFAGGDLVTGPRSAVEAFAAGRRAALAMHCYLQKLPLPEVLPPLASRPTDLVVDLTGVPQVPGQPLPSLDLQKRLADPGAEVHLGLTAAQAGREAERCLSCECSQCVKNCPFLNNYVAGYPRTEKGIVNILQTRGAAEPTIPYSCHVCGLCQAVCPKDLHAGLACLEFRRHLVAIGKGPLPQHRGIQNYVKWGTSPTFTLTRPDPATGRAERVFFPGCSLPGHSPALVRAAYGYLRGRLPHTGIILNCCGAPTNLLGEQAPFEKVGRQVAAELATLGAGEIIAACTHCLETLAVHLPGVRIRSLYEVMVELGLPPGAKARAPQVFNIHDACGARHSPQIHEAVRRLVTGMGHRFEEMEHSQERSICCGSGGMAPAVNAPLAQKMTEFRLSEASHDLVSYCASCQARFVGAGRPSLHLLDLVFNPDWARTRHLPPSGSLTRWWRRWRLKRYFQGL